MISEKKIKVKNERQQLTKQTHIVINNLKRRFEVEAGFTASVGAARSYTDTFVFYGINMPI